MTFEFFSKPDATPLALANHSWWTAEARDKAEGYIPDAGLSAAMDVARFLGQPLLLTGDPGTGKTQFAYYVSWMLALDPPLIYETKSTSSARDLFYTYDLLGRFHDAQLAQANDNVRMPSTDQLDYVTYNALGLAILRASDPVEVSKWTPKNFKHGGPRHSVVLVDEIDKAPRDFPNDLLNEVENMYFKIPELRDTDTMEAVRISASAKFRPILILTSNSEQHLPDAFLRRCVYYNIPFPKRDRLLKIIKARTDIDIDPTKKGSGQEALEIFDKLREPNNGLKKRPATAELLNFLLSLKEMGALDAPLKNTAKLSTALNTMVKTASDQTAIKVLLKEWLPNTTG